MNQTPTLYRAAVINPLNNGNWRYLPDAGLLIERGRVVDLQPIGAFGARPELPCVELDGVISPGFVDVHTHWVQYRVRGRFQAQLLPWLKEHIWPEEASFADSALAGALAEQFFKDSIRAGTVMGMAYSSAHAGALQAASDVTLGDWLIGDVVMETDAPDALVAASAKDIGELSARAGRYGPQRYAVTPRFALNCSAPFMRDMGQLARQQGYYVQTHLSESVEEINEVHRRFADAQDYTDVYDRAGLLGERSVLGHCVHLSPREWRCLAARGSWVAHCPSSNEALDSGRMDLTALREHGVKYALASDVGGGPSHSMLHVMQRYLDQHRAAGAAVAAGEALYRATLAGAQCMGRGAYAGNFAPGKRADFLLLPRLNAHQSVDSWLEEIVQGGIDDLETRVAATWLGGIRQNGTR